MKTNRFYSHISALTVLTACLLWAASLQAQTFRGQAKLNDSPKLLEASIYPVTNRPSTIRVNFNNATGRLIWVMIRDEKGAIVYDEFTAIIRYRKYFNLSSLPTGTYTVNLSAGKQNEQYAKTFIIEPPIMGRITMENRGNTEVFVENDLLVSH